jgi:ATP phosphoribosyltransferase regulatory subunit HisZ
LFGKKEYTDAAALYQAAVQPATGTKDALSLLEAWRMMGACLEHSKAYREAWECNQNALDAGEQLDSTLRPNTTLPYVGQALLRLSPQLGKHEEDEPLRRRMAALCGADWEKRISTKRPQS